MHAKTTFEIKNRSFIVRTDWGDGDKSTFSILLTEDEINQLEDCVKNRKP